MSRFGFDVSTVKLTLVSNEEKPPQPLDFTVFHNLSCSEASRLSKSWPEVCEMLRSPDVVPRGKLSAPLLKMATFGEERNPDDSQPDPNKLSLRHNNNLLTITGVEADYDEGEMTMEEAVHLLEKAGIRAVLYSSWGDGLVEPPKYLGGPRWRIIAPLSEPASPSTRSKMVARINGALGGVLADESFVLAQGFFIGARPGGEYKCKVTFQDPLGGQSVDKLPELDQIAIYKRNASQDDSPDERYGVKLKPGSLVVAPQVYSDLRTALSAIPADCPYQDWWRILRGISRLSDTYQAKALAREWSTSSDNPTHTAAAFEDKWRAVMREDSVISYQTIFYEARQCNPEWDKDLPARELAQTTSLDNFTLLPLTLEELRDAQLHPRIVLPHILYADVRTRISAGGVGKTTLAMFEAVTLALGRTLWGQTPERPMRTVMVTREDTREILTARMREIMKALRLELPEVEQVLRNVNIMDLSGVSYRISEVSGDVVQPHAKNLAWLIKMLRDFKPDWLIMDPMVSFGVGEQRVNDAEQGLIEAMRILKKEFDGCIEGIHHSGKANAREKTLDQYSGRGGSALSDGSRMVCVMQPLTAQEWADATGTYLEESESGIVMAMPKMSYCRPQEAIYVKRSGYSFTHVLPLIAPSQSETQSQHDDMVFTAVKEAWFRNQPLTAQGIKEDYKALFYNSLKRDAVMEAVGRLKRDGRIIQQDTKGGRGNKAALEPIIIKQEDLSKYAISE